MEDIAAGMEDIARPIREAGFVFVRGALMRARLPATTDWQAFAASWNDLGVDTYLAEQGRLRRRRYAVYRTGTDGTLLRQPHQAHYQSLDYNPLFGGVERWFAPVTSEVGEGPSMRGILGFAGRLFSSLAPAVNAWRVEVHQFRIEARAGDEGYPTPEGVHRDGVDFVLVLLVNRRNILSGTTTVHQVGGGQVGSFTLTDPFDSALLDDMRVAHGVTPVLPCDPDLPAYRDVLVVTFRRER